MGAGLTSFIKTVQVPEPGLGNNTGDAERLKAVLKPILGGAVPEIPHGLVQVLPGRLRKWNHTLKCALFRKTSGWVLAGIQDPASEIPVCGLAVDIGTTRIAARLIDMDRSMPLGEVTFDNPQASIAPDVLARIHHAKDRAGLDELQQLVVQGINRAVESLCFESGVSSRDILLVAAAGNTAMTHLFLGIDPSHIIREPYIPAVNIPEVLLAGAIGMSVNSLAALYLFPNIGAYFGGDLIAGIYFAGLHTRETPAILVDVGTNAEVVVGSRDWLIGCAGAAGPALEGGVSDMGMTAGPGVIDSVIIDPITRAIDIHTIGDDPPRGICGSGMIDLAAQLFLSGMLDIRGTFSPERCGDRLVEIQGVACFVVVPAGDSGTGGDILLTQIDMNSLTSSKAAMHSILTVIVEKTAGLSMEELDTFFVAGTFGSFINPSSAIAIGMLPDIPLEKFKVIGNSSLEGAAKFLSDPGAMDEVLAIQERITYIELNVNQEFMTIFSGAKFYPHTDRSRFPSVRIFGEANGSGV